MPRFHRLAGALALSLGFAGAAHAQSFSGFYAFGDSLTDSGNVGDVNGLPPGSSFTTNPDPVMVEIVANAFGLQAVNSLQGGSNFAWGGACVNAAGPCLNPVPNIPTQISQYLTATGGSADPNALYSIWGGANDIFATLVLDPGNAQANTVAAATAYVQQIARLQAAGANYIIVYNLPNLGVTPQFASTPNAGSVSQITVVYNSALNTGLAQLGDGIIAVDTFGLITEVMADPGLYGLSNVTGTACSPPNSVACGPQGSGLPAEYAPGTNETWLFADGVHPTGIAHRMLANVILSTIAAPVQVSMAGEAGVKINENHVRAFTDELLSDFYLDREVGGVRGWATVQYGDQDFDASAAVPGASADVLSLSLGANWRASENVYWGAAITLGNHDNDVGSGNIEGRGVIASLYGTVRFGGGGYLQGAISGGSTDLDIDRSIVLGEAVRVESGNTNAGSLGAELAFGWLFGAPGNLQHGPFVSASWLQQEIDGYAEDSGRSTSMNFAGFDRDSLVARVGYQLQGSMGTSDRSIRPYLRVAYNEEQEDDQVFVNAGSNTMNGRFTMPGFTPSKDWISADLGLNWQLGGNVTAFLAYSGRFSDDQQDGNSVSLGLRTSF
ncbi:autotransporter domain-containing protein [Arenimonas fontis]|uniref:Autotransporter domain-containing protein n=1 Tax=Arenimonas fontis TaxID=2608255 RepID=A0A5B2Z619_9GAMM|nr:autotransporter domain-containing protein [Arenimonas fontis]KAA2284278.1 autotransporter domain-containing protein [Arenimonas fontis]